MAANGTGGVHRSAVARFDQLPRLPFASQESEWVAQAFRECGEDVVTLTGQEVIGDLTGDFAVNV